ncbi:hypothetical protein B0H16DRAFT_1560383 [Mycena metata]|uniref:MYND-type domain-containing protein n=1 Tax=Mycena metata TaxID=1033252 RepID=A0AAD7IKD2_9AGAR|nr:hypothetical protein B0H16DRAFT_1560383 [Mycena metata]
MHCRHCGDKPGTLICSGCRKVSYCSSECQLVSWKHGHKELCHGRNSTKPLTPIPPLNPPPVRMSPAEERAARAKKSWGLASQCMFTLDSRYVKPGQPGVYFALPDPPKLELVTENLHLSDRLAPLDFPHANNEILCEITVAIGTKPLRYRAIVPTPPDFHAANERSCDLGPPYRVSEELCNRTALGLQDSFAKQIFALPEMRQCANRVCQNALLGIESTGPRKVVVGSKLVHRTRKVALEDIWTPCCYDETCVATIRTMLTNAMLKDREK